jgi:ThiF family/Prokaryotic homologs of the JAB domain
MTRLTVRMNGDQHAELRSHLYPGDGSEAIAFALCGRVARHDREPNATEEFAITVCEVFLLPYHECPVRRADRITWNTATLAPLLERAAKRHLAVLKIHSHPTGYKQFSDADDISDRDFFSSVQSYVDDDRPHVSAVMLPSGKVFARSVDSAGNFHPARAVSVAGPDFSFWHDSDFRDGDAASETPRWETDSRGRPVAPSKGDGKRAFTLRTAQTFGAATNECLAQLSVAIVGASGTGSPMGEMASRLGFGEVVLVDDGRVGDKNRNRILHSTGEDVQNARYKVDVLADAIERMGLGTCVVRICNTLWSPESVRRVAQCDVVFGCMDSMDGRVLLNRLATYYQIPYIDIGVRIDADGLGGIDNVSGSVNYLRPGGSSLISRGALSQADVDAATLSRTDPTAYHAQVKQGYIRGAAEDRPAVISLNMMYASLGMNEFLARLHTFRNESNANFERVRIILQEGRMINEPETKNCAALMRFVGLGDVSPLLGIPSLSVRNPSE